MEPHEIDQDWLIGEGDMVDWVRRMDWSKTPLGPRSTWHKTLRMATNLILASKFPMAILWGKELIFIYNDGYRVIADQKHPYALGHSTREVWPEIWPFNKPIYEQVMIEGKVISFEDQAYRINRKGQMEDAYFTICYSPIRMTNEGFEGKIGGTLVVLQETTRYVVNERKLCESQNFLRSLIDSTPSDIFAMNPSHQFTLANDAMGRTYGVSKEKILGMTEYQIFSKKVADRVSADNETILKSGKSLTLEQEVESLDHTRTRTVISSKFAIRDAEDHIIGMGGVTTDITERKQLEQELRQEKLKAEETAKMKAQFLDVAAHELRNPITVILLMIETFERQLKKEEPISPQHLARLRGPSQRLKRLVNDLLDVSRLERGLVALDRVCVDLAQLTSQCLEDFRLIAPTRHFSLKSPNHPIKLELDPFRITQVISNLLDNATKYTPEGGAIEIEIESRQNSIRVSVQDHGPGISKTELNSIFNPFHRGDSASCLRTNGLGLGLSLCQGIIRLHGGTIGVMSETGQGSRFYFELPLH